jgi:hypothetical protein
MPTKQQFSDAAKIAQGVFEEVNQTLKGQSYERIREAVKDLMLSKLVRLCL